MRFQRRGPGTNKAPSRMQPRDSTQLPHTGRSGMSEPGQPAEPCPKPLGLEQFGRQQQIAEMVQCGRDLVALGLSADL